MVLFLDFQYLQCQLLHIYSFNCYPIVRYGNTFFRKINKEGGETERAKVNRYTKILTLFLSLAEGLGIYLTYKSTGIFINPGPLTGFLVVLSFMAGTAYLCG